MEDGVQTNQEMEPKVKKIRVKGSAEWDWYFEQRKKYSGNWQNKKIQQGLCCHCGKNPINPRSKRRCSMCLDRARLASERYRRSIGITASTRGANCHRPIVPRDNSNDLNKE